MRHHELLDEAEDARRRTAKPDPVPPRAAILAHAGNHALVRYLQRKRVPVSGGVFYDHTYEADNEVAVGQKKTGAKMRLEFEPKADLPADRVSLVQTVKRTLKVGGQRIEQGTSGMALRGDVEKEPVIDAELTGQRDTAQEVPELAAALHKLDALAASNRALKSLIEDKLEKALAIADNGTYAKGSFATTTRGILRSHLISIREALDGAGNAAALRHIQAAQDAFAKIVVKSSYLANLDPRYTEKRMKQTDAFAEKPGDANRPEHHGHSATKREGRWEPAQLRDWPGPTADAATPVTGGMEFEVAAMTEATAQKPATFVGSVKWGFSTSPPNTARIDPAELALKNQGDASPEFFAAAERWNKMQVPSPQGPVAPLQLPVHQKPAGPQPGSMQPTTTVQKPPTTSPPTTPPKPTADKPPVPTAAKPPTANEITARWYQLRDATPPKKRKEIGLTAQYKTWKDHSSEPGFIEWSTKYLDWLNGELLKDAAALERRWNEIITRLEDLVRTETIHWVRVDARNRHEKWKALYAGVKQGTWPAPETFFEEPEKFLDDIVAKWKGNPAARWSPETLYWKVQKDKTLTGTYWT